MKRATFPRWLFTFCALSIALLVLVACTPSPQSPSPAPVSVGPSATSDSVVSADRRMGAVVTGYYEARDGGLFTMCGETSRRKVRNLEAATATALAKGEPSQPRFLIAGGTLVGRDEVDIGAFELISGDAWNCESRLEPLIFAGRDTRVLWTLEVTPAAVTFVAAAGSPPLQFAYRAFDQVDGKLVFDAKGPSGDLSIRLRAESCVEPMTDTVFGLSASVHSKGQDYAGCAWRGFASP